MKSKMGILSVLTFTTIVFSYSFAAADFWEDLAKGVAKGLEDSTKTDAQKKKEKKEEEFYKKFSEIIRKLPASARVVVPEIKEAPNSDTSLLFREVLQHELETAIEEQDVKIVERVEFKEYEKEIVYSQTGEVDPGTAAKFGKAVGATHMVLGKVIADGGTVTISIRVVEIEKMQRIGSATTTFDIPVPQEVKQKRQQIKELEQQQQKTQTLINESFSVAAGSYKTYSRDLTKSGTLKIDISASFDVYVLVMDEINYRAWQYGNRQPLVFAEEKVTSTAFSLSIPKGRYYILVWNRDSLLTSASVGMTATFIPE